VGGDDEFADAEVLGHDRIGDSGGVMAAEEIAFVITLLAETPGGDEFGTGSETSHQFFMQKPIFGGNWPDIQEIEFPSQISAHGASESSQFSGPGEGIFRSCWKISRA
jgi:hypothetical protein